MRRAITYVLVIAVALLVGIFVGRDSAAPASDALLADPPLARALIAAGAAPVASDCALAVPSAGEVRLADVLQDYFQALREQGARSVLECGGRAPDACSLLYGRPAGEHESTNILIFRRQGESVLEVGVQCLSQ